jgi:hypothetical protein
MEPTDTLLSVDLSTLDCYYRFRRDFRDFSTVVYVHVQNLAILPDCQTYGPDVIKSLKTTVKVWNKRWTTLRVFEKDGNIQYKQDDWEPHFVPTAAISNDLPRLNILDLCVNRRLKNRVYQIYHEKRPYILKICPFKFHLEHMIRELRAYNVLRERGCTLVATMSAFVYERSEDQVVGFICEELKGDFAKPDDYEECKRSLQQLHSYGLLHGDLNKFNIIITADGPRFFDLEKSTLDIDGDISEHEFSCLKEEELEGLNAALCDQDGRGKPRL